MVPQDLIAMIQPRWRADLERFIETGEATPDFLRYLDTAPECGPVLDAAFSLQSRRIKEFSQTLDVLSRAGVGETRDSDNTFVRAVRGVLDGFRTAAGLNEDKRKLVFSKALDELDPGTVESLIEAVDNYRAYARQNRASA